MKITIKSTNNYETLCKCRYLLKHGSQSNENASSTRGGHGLGWIWFVKTQPNPLLNGLR